MDQKTEKYKVGVITISDSRFKLKKQGKDQDKSGKIIQNEVEDLGYSSIREIVPDDKNEIEEKINKFLSEDSIDMIITTGGTGIMASDRTYETVKPLLDKILPGFGEAMRRKGYERAGGLGILTRTIAGISQEKPIFCLPGPPDSVKVGMKLIKKELPKITSSAKS